jgi:transposase-like protein
LALRWLATPNSSPQEDLMHSLHPQARTTPAVRQEIARSSEPTGVLARRFSVSPETIRKWRKRGAQDCQDHSSRPHKLPWKATEEERAIVCALRQATGFPLDDLTVVVSHFLPPARQRKRESGTFKDYDLGFGHMDIKPLPKLETADGERRKRFLYVAIDRCSRLRAPGGLRRRADHQRGRVPERGGPCLPLHGHAHPDGQRILLYG